MGKTFRISCDEATAICDKNQYGEASLSEKMKLMFHLAFCGYCSKYSKQNTLISNIMDKSFTPCDEGSTMPEELKKEIEKKLRQELEK